MSRFRGPLLALAAALLCGAAPAADVGRLRGELQSSAQSRDSARAEAASLRDEIARLNAQLAELKAVETTSQTSVQGKRGRLDLLNGREAELKAEMDANQGELARLLGALELYRRNPPPALLVSPRSAREAVQAAILVDAVRPELVERAKVFRARAEQLQRIRRDIVSANEDLFTSESALADNRAQVEQALAEKTALQRQLTADAADADRKAQGLTQQLRALGAPTNVTLPAAPTSAPSGLRSPVQGQVLRRFGQASPGRQTSDGLTFAGGPAGLVRAPAAGVVEYSGALNGWGGIVILNVGGGYHVVLAGLERSSATAGRRVATGDLLGALPARGAAQPELYMELRKGGAPTDPAPWLRPAPVAELRGPR